MIQPLNDSKPARHVSWWVLVGANLVTAAASAAFGAVALLSPAMLLPPGHPEITSGAVYYAAMYGVRAVPLAVAFVLVALRARPGFVGALVPLLAVAGMVQLGDIAIGAAYGTTAVAGGTVAAAIHLGSRLVLARWARAERRPAGAHVSL